jgi:hypothetical protein
MGECIYEDYVLDPHSKVVPIFDPVERKIKITPKSTKTHRRIRAKIIHGSSGTATVTPDSAIATSGQPATFTISRSQDEFTQLAQHARVDQHARRHPGAVAADDGAVDFEAVSDDGRADLEVSPVPVAQAAVQAYTEATNTTAQATFSGGSSTWQQTFTGPPVSVGQTTCTATECDVPLGASIALDVTNTDHDDQQIPLCIASYTQTIPQSTTDIADLYLHFDADGELISADLQGYGDSPNVGSIGLEQGDCVDQSATDSPLNDDVPVSVAALESDAPVTVNLADSGSDASTIGIPETAGLTYNWTALLTFKMTSP